MAIALNRMVAPGGPSPPAASPGFGLLLGDAMATGFCVFTFSGCRHYKLAQFGVRGQQTEVMDLVHSG